MTSSAQARTAARRLPQATVGETVRVVATVVLPLLARGLIVRRPAMVRLAERSEADRAGVRLLQRLRARHGRGPLRLRIPFRAVVLVLDPAHVRRVLAQSPEPFSPATREKRAALAHFQPHGVLISTGAERAERRRYNEEVLQTDRVVHGEAAAMIRAVEEEARDLLATATADGELTWEAYAQAWWRVVRRVVLGDGARDDEELTDDLRTLRATANWAFLHPRRPRLRARFEQRLGGHLDRAEAGSLAAVMVRTADQQDTEPLQQVPQWLFAFDAAAWAGYRALALMASHPQALERARAEGADVGSPARHELAFGRSCVLESLRLWPTTPAVLRESTERTWWEGGPMPAGTMLFTYAPLFHRDDEHLAEADRFAPELWDEGRDDEDWPLIPFSAGPAVCAGRNLVLHVTSTFLAGLVSGQDLRLTDPGRLPPERLPSTLDPFSLRFELTPTTAAPAGPALP